jgi:4-hydroxy-3-methylbut-2-enyl diphosphate reductase
VQQVIDRLKSLGAISVRTMQGLHENVSFPLPKGLSRKVLELGDSKVVE